ncbi:MAG TPA: hypothetical protein VMF67_14800 [Rhizomicrobium sp.]|nr:hypothetical protein [Rhizomicrobium sp.]
MSASSALTCTLAFNLTFFVQEFFLVIPKALTPGLYPTLFHNNHTWTGDNPVAGLLQGTGALADLAIGLIFTGLLSHSADRPVTLRLFLFWMAYQGFYLALPQFVIGAMNPGNDVGMAMAYLRLSAGERWAAALIAFVVMAVIGFRLVRQFIRLMAISAETATGTARAGFVFRSAMLPSLVSVLLLIPFREPRNLTEVLLLPLIVMISGMLWVQCGAWFAPSATQTDRTSPSFSTPLLALLIVLAIFQIVLRPGIRFY